MTSRGALLEIPRRLIIPIPFFPGYQLMVPVKELSSGEASSVIDLKGSYQLSVNGRISEFGAGNLTLRITING